MLNAGRQIKWTGVLQFGVVLIYINKDDKGLKIALLKIQKETLKNYISFSVGRQLRWIGVLDNGSK